MSRSASKASHYVQLLDGSRCEGDWEAVPELVRKVRKHAAARVCLALTAETEMVIERATSRTPAATRLSNTPLSVEAHLPRLQAAIDGETTQLEDRFQARVCVGWLHWVAGEYDLALQRLPADLDAELAAPDGPPNGPDLLAVSDWTRVCALKSAYLRANCLVRHERAADALAVFGDGLPCVTSAHAAQQGRKQLRYWSELFLTEFCMLLSHALEIGEMALQDANCLVAFRAWAKYWEGTTSAAQLGGFGFRGSVPRRRIWFEYYAVLAALLADDLAYPTGHAPVTASDALSAHSELRIELKRVEAVYETLLLEETRFPRADEERSEIEDFVRLAVQNWAIMKGRGWREQDLGQGGKESLSRGILDLLYRASTKTYHSTAILRHLFTVHLAVAEFDLAFKAFDSYLGLVKKGKARVAKTGADEPSLDPDATVLETVATCIAALCRYGSRDAAERAYGLAQELEQCLQELAAALGRVNEEEDQEDHVTTSLVATVRGADLPRRVLALCWQAVGLAAAQWSRATFDAVRRPELQAKAIRCLRKSLSPEFGRSASLRGVFALGLLLAEQRELAAAIDVVRGALLTHRSPDNVAAAAAASDHDFLHGPFWRERAMIPLWHLLALLLSARQDYVMAARACEGAFEQFQDPAVLFGHEHLYRSEHLNDAAVTNNGAAAAAIGGVDSNNESDRRGVVDDMDDYEKERILEVKMTQLALVELLESPKVAVNASLELLSLYARLFGPLQSLHGVGVPALVTTAKAGDGAVPRSSAGTLRSIKGSLFGRSSDRTGRPATKQQATGGTSSRPQTTQTVASGDAPTIQVTRDGSERPPSQSRRSSAFDRRSQSSGKRNSLRKRDRSGSRRRASSVGGGSVIVHGGAAAAMPDSPPPQLGPLSYQTPTVSDGDVFFTPNDGDGDAASRANGGSGSGSGSVSGDVLPFSSGRRRLSTSTGPPVSMSRQASQVDSIVSRTAAGNVPAAAADTDAALSLMPLVLFSAEHVQKRRNTVLVEVWLMIAGFYRRAGMFDDAKGAATEAQKLVQGLEEDAAKDAAACAGWADKKRVDELWADVWTELGHLSLDKGSPYTARLDFEAALTHFPDHPGAIVGLSNILLDIYSEALVLPPAIPRLELADGSVFPARPSRHSVRDGRPVLPLQPLGLVVRPKQDGGGAGDGMGAAARNATSSATVLTLDDERGPTVTPSTADTDLPPPYLASKLPLGDRLAARDRASGLLSGLTKMGSAWNDADAWFALARAHEESGQPDKAKEALWWCVELEEAAGVRPWNSVATGGYVL